MIAWFRRNALNIVLLLMAASVALSVYTVTRIQSARTQNILTFCQDQNARHDATLRRLDSEITDYVRRYPKRAKEIRDSKHDSIAIINALAPHQNCQHVLTGSQ